MAASTTEVTAAPLWARAEWRRRPVALAVLVLFVALGTGVVLTVAAGAYRTATAYDLLVEATNRYEVAIAAAAHGITTATRRRRHDLAVMRAMGFVRRQIGEVIAWQATAVAGVTTVAGVPIGFIIGRQVWRVVAERMPVFPEIAVPWAAIVAGALLIANLVAVPPAVLARRVRAAEVLRAE